jgi:hypothetical protein
VTSRNSEECLQRRRFESARPPAAYHRIYSCSQPAAGNDAGQVTPRAPAKAGFNLVNNRKRWRKGANSGEGKRLDAIGWEAGSPAAAFSSACQFFPQFANSFQQRHFGTGAIGRRFQPFAA